MGAGIPKTELEKKRQLSFLSTFDRKYQGFRREMERLRRAGQTGRAFGGRWPTDGLERIARSLIGAGAVYGLSEIADWARLFLARLDQIKSASSPPSTADLSFLAGQVRALGKLQVAAVESAGGDVQAARNSIPPFALAQEGDLVQPPTAIAHETGTTEEVNVPDDGRGAAVRTGYATAVSATGALLGGSGERKSAKRDVLDQLSVFICVRDANVRKKISFILRGAHLGDTEVEQPEQLCERIAREHPELIIIDLEDKAPFGAAALKQLQLDPGAAYVPVLKLATEVIGGQLDLVGKPVVGEQLLDAIRTLIRGTRPTDGLGLVCKETTLDELVRFVGQELTAGVVDAVYADKRQTRFDVTAPGALFAHIQGLVAHIREMARTGSGGDIDFIPLFAGAVPTLALSGQSGPVHVDGTSLEGLRLVVADGEPIVRQRLDELFSTVGMKVRTAANGEDALDAVVAGRPDCVLAGVDLPSLDGWTLATRLKQDYRLKDIPLVIMTGAHSFVRSFGPKGASPAQAGLAISGLLPILKPRVNLAERLEKIRDFSGRTEQIGAVNVLAMVANIRKDAQVYFRDSVNDFEVAIRNGALCSINMSGVDGAFASGRRALLRLLGMEHGRFEVREAAKPCRAQFDRPLDEILDELCEQQNRLVRMVVGESLLAIKGVELNGEEVDRLIEIWPGAARKIVERLRAGVLPISLIEKEEVAAPLVETVLLELVRQGVIVHLDGPPPPADRVERARDTREWQTLDMAVVAGSTETTTPVELDELVEIDDGPPPFRSSRFPAPIRNSELPATRTSSLPSTSRSQVVWPIIAAVLFIALAISGYWNINGADFLRNPGGGPLSSNDAGGADELTPSTVPDTATSTAADGATNPGGDTDTTGGQTDDGLGTQDTGTDTDAKENKASKPLSDRARARREARRAARQEARRKKREAARAASSSQSANGPAMGTLRVSSPSDGGLVVVLVDGRKRGIAPLSVSVKVGLHEVTFVRDQQRTLRMVSIKEGTTKEISPKF